MRILTKPETEFHITDKKYCFTSLYDHTVIRYLYSHEDDKLKEVELQFFSSYIENEKNIPDFIILLNAKESYKIGFNLIGFLSTCFQ